MPPILHLCQFNFETQDIRVVGSEVDGGTSLSGMSDVIQIDGGGFWQADFSSADFGGVADADRANTLAWRAINAGLSGGATAIIRFCDRHHQPVYDAITVPHSDDTPFGDDTEYVSGSASAAVIAVVNGQAAGLNATIIDISLTAPRALIGGERFTHVHETWLDRAYEIRKVETISGGVRLTFQPPIRGGIAVGDPIDFDNPRCVMRRTSPPTNALSIGLYSSASIAFVEDMRPPVA